MWSIESVSRPTQVVCIEGNEEDYELAASTVMNPVADSSHLRGSNTGIESPAMICIFALVVRHSRPASCAISGRI